MYTVKNEGATLLQSIGYHRAIGFDHFFVFLDGTTDDTASRLAGVAGVHVRKSVAPDEAAVADGPDWMAAIAPWWSTDLGVRQRINTLAATRLCQEMGIDWLLCIDPDEVFHASLGNPPSAARTREFFLGIPQHVDQILLRNLEAIPPASSTGNLLTDCTRFLARFPATEAVWRVMSGGIRRVVKIPAAQAWFDYLFYQVRFMGALPRLLVHPTTGKRIPAGYFLGYSNHKSAIRPERASSFDFVIHYWRRWNRAPRNVLRGNVLHCDFPSLEYFIAKFRQRQPSHAKKVFHVRYWLARIARESSPQEVEAFYRKYIALSDERVMKRLSRRRIVLHVTSVAALAAELPAWPPARDGTARPAVQATQPDAAACDPHSTSAAMTRSSGISAPSPRQRPQPCPSGEHRRQP
jgi:hypothetical protein